MGNLTLEGEVYAMMTITYTGSWIGRNKPRKKKNRRQLRVRKYDRLRPTSTLLELHTNFPGCRVVSIHKKEKKGK